ncbi:uncharacterized protein PV09_02441 [Verruconis gallopava]|uniref:NAD(P)-binding protein n=1 Tax=Verruconis gallopava TaxID=253628 RepID=A0A0D2AJI0_9PEZI|nr:uncharacterized protein PV09_02441 [Verruconis gallopava]KIW06750.1 hypothetical protein PV09_02441 [Verruconis gallopava]
MSPKAADLYNVNGLVAVVTGGSTSIGLAITKALAQNGAKRVYIVGRRREKLEAAAEELAVDGNVVPLVGEVTSKESLAEIARQVEDDAGYVHLLVANAGITGPKIRPALDPATGSIDDFVERAWSTPASDFVRAFDVNVAAVHYSVLAFLRLLDRGNRAHNQFRDGVASQVVAVSAVPGCARLKAASFAYGSSKAALAHLMKHLSVWCARWNIRCNVVAPGSLSSLGLSHHFMIPIPLPDLDDEEDG